jgi:glucosamine kinase
MSTGLVIGIDGGGTYTRALAADLTGRVLASAESGAASPNKTPHAEQHVRQAIQDVLAGAGREPGDVRALVAGIAGLDAPDDQAWAARFTDLSGLAGHRVQVNDAVVAHAGALASRPGIIAIGGTGSIILAVTAEGRQLRNYDFHHYAPASARHLAYDLVYRILAGQASTADAPLVADVLVYWQMADLPALHALGAGGFVEEPFERTWRFGEMGPLVTEAAARGLPLARRVCDHAADALATGIQLVGASFTERPVPVALIGGAVRSAYMQQAVRAALDRCAGHPYRLVDPAFPCAAGAVLMALKAAGVTPDATVERNLAAWQTAPGSVGGTG